MTEVRLFGPRPEPQRPPRGTVHIVVDTVDCSWIHNAIFYMMTFVDWAGIGQRSSGEARCWVKLGIVARGCG